MKNANLYKNDIRIFVLLIFIFSSFLFVKGQVSNLNFVNCKTKEWLQFTSSSRSDNYFQLVSKISDSCKIAKIKIPKTCEIFFLDSIKKVGFSNKTKYQDKQKEYNLSIELQSYYFDGLAKEDSIFNFVYKITLTNLKQNKSRVKFDSFKNTQKSKIINAFLNKEYKVSQISEIKGTSIIIVDIESVLLFGTPSSVFSPTRQFYY